VKNKQNIPSITLLLLMLFTIAGCASNEVKEIVEYPSISELPVMVDYNDTSKNWTTKSVCWIGIDDNPQWKWELKSTPRLANRRIRNSTANMLLTLVRRELQAEGFQIKDFGEAGITRRERLSIDKQIFLRGFTIKQIKVKEGYCYDMKLLADVVTYPESSQIVACDISGRSFVPDGETKKWPDIFHDCVGNIRRAPAFRDALEIVNLNPGKT